MNRLTALLGASLVFAAWATAAESPLWMYVGTYTGQGSNGIYVYRFDPRTGEITQGELAAEVKSPSFLAVAPDNRTLYAVSETGPEGVLSAYRIDPAGGKLTLINQQTTRGGGPCFVSVDHHGRAVMIANYGGGSVASYRVEPGGGVSEPVSFFQHTGSGANPSRQERPHAHSINPAPDDRFAVAADLGTDELRIYRLDAGMGSLSPNDPPAVRLEPGSGPRHFTFHPRRPWAYVINELRSSVTMLRWDAARGVLTTGATASTLPPDFRGENTTAEVLVHPNGKWLYGSNRGHDSIAVFRIAKDGSLRPIQHAATRGNLPRNFRIDPTGRWLVAANMRGNNMTVFRIDRRTGRLTPTAQDVQLNQPVCIKFVPAKRMN